MLIKQVRCQLAHKNHCNFAKRFRVVVKAAQVFPCFRDTAIEQFLPTQHVSERRRSRKVLIAHNLIYCLSRNFHLMTLSDSPLNEAIAPYGACRPTSLGFPMACASTSVASSRKLSGISFLSTFVTIRSSGILIPTSSSVHTREATTSSQLVKGRSVM